MFRLYDTASGDVAELVPREQGRIGIYVCGPTVYGPPHVGHGRFTLVYDVLRRYLEYRGSAVTHVSNITDIDDKIIARAHNEGRPWQDVASESEAEWWAAMDALGVLHPTEIPKATEYVAEMGELIAQLVDRQAAYETNDGVYLSAETVPGYGLLAHQSLSTLLHASLARVEHNEDKRSPIDFALWKKAKPGEPTWPSSFGPGRPGWHTECVVMSLALLGEGFDLHGGGRDLMFPHHENERAQAVAVGRPFTRHWMHNGLVEVGGEKMSKSLANFLTLAELLERADPRSYRLLVLRSHYRSPLEVNEETLTDAENALARVDACARRFADAPRDLDTAVVDGVVRRFVDAMDDDLNTPIAVAGLFEAIRQANTLRDKGAMKEAAALARGAIDLFAVLGLIATASVTADAEVAELVAERDRAREARDFPRADALRLRLEELGWIVEDGPTGTSVHRRDFGGTS